MSLMLYGFGVVLRLRFKKNASQHAMNKVAIVRKPMRNMTEFFGVLCFEMRCEDGSYCLDGGFNVWEIIRPENAFDNFENILF